MHALRFAAYLVIITLTTVASDFIPRASAKSEVNYSKLETQRVEFVQAQVPTPSVKFPQETYPEVKLREIASPQIQVQENEQLTIITLPSDIIFDYGKDKIRPDAEIALRQVSQAISNHYPDTWLQILGHTDLQGSKDYNLKLSEQRVAAVQRWLSEKGGIDLSLMTKEGYGETQPIAPNKTSVCGDNLAARQKNSRIEIVIQKLANLG